MPNFTPVIVFTNQKGGVGKTTSADAIADGLRRRGLKVLAVDMDPQGSLGRIESDCVAKGTCCSSSFLKGVQVVCTEDGQATVPGDLDNLIFSLEERIKEYASQNGLILACGPTPFLRTIQKFASQYHARCQLSLENKMACGVGGCLGCVVRTTEAWPDPAKRGAPVQCCTQGPVFWSDQVIF